MTEHNTSGGTRLPDSLSRMRSRNVLFTLSNFSFEKHFGRYSKGGFTYNYQEGIACIAAYIREKGYTPHFHDTDFDGSFDTLLARIEELDIGLLALPCYTVDLQDIIVMCTKVKEHFPELVIVVGNVHPTNYPEDVLAMGPCLDYVVIGEAEESFGRLLDALHDGGERSSLPGIAWRENNAVAKTSNADKPDIDSLPYPAYDIFPMEKYSLQPTLVKRYPTFTIMASRGCPFKCAFCDVKSMMGRKVRYRSPESIVEMMRHLSEKYGAQGFAFQDSTLTVSKKWIREFCERYRASGLGKPWMAYSRVDTINEEMVRDMRDAGCWCISFGMESGNQKTLDLLDKKTTIEQNRAVGRMVIKAGLVLQTSFIVCLPGEDEQDALNTYRFAKEVGGHICRFFLPTPYPKTKLYDLCVADGMPPIDPHDSARFDFLNYGDDLPYVNPRIGAKRMIALARRFERNYYMMPKVLTRNLLQLRDVHDWKKYFTAFRAVYGI